MTYKEVSNMVGEIGLPYAYYQFPNGTELSCPFVCFFFTGSDDLMADNSNYQRIRPLAIELYTNSKDFTLEETVEGVLADHGITYAREESYIDDQRMYLVVYTADIIITEEMEESENGK